MSICLKNFPSHHPGKQSSSLGETTQMRRLPESAGIYRRRSLEGAVLESQENCIAIFIPVSFVTAKTPGAT